MLLKDHQKQAIAAVAARAWGKPLADGLRVTINFQPDRYVGDRLLLEEMAADTVYRSQFETKTSNGGLSAFPGGDRWLWESRIFGGAYDTCDPADRPKYGALNVQKRATGASPRFGSSFLRLKAAVSARCTFCYPDSYFQPSDFGVFQRFDLIERALADTRDDRLDFYIEAQIHGPVSLVQDVEALVLDPCFKGSPIEEAARKFPFPIEWHPGFRVKASLLLQHQDYRGAQFVKIASALAVQDELTPDLIGQALQSKAYEFQDIKKIWHYLARFGDPSKE
jgi:hypothetical protein